MGKYSQKTQKSHRNKNQNEKSNFWVHAVFVFRYNLIALYMYLRGQVTHFNRSTIFLFMTP